MGYVKNTIKDIVKGAGSRSAAIKEAGEWFSEGLNERKQYDVKSTRRRFEPGKIYVFEYDPIDKNLPWYDKNPVVLAVEQIDKNDLGINLNLIPIEFKEILLDELYERMKSQIKPEIDGKRAYEAELQKPLRITYEGMKTYLQKYGYDFALRQYIPERKRNQAVISYERWPDIALCDLIDLNGTTIQEVREMFSNHQKKNI